MDNIQSSHSVQNQSGDKKLDHITLSDGTTMLLDLLSAISDSDRFSKFLQDLVDVNAIVPHDSPVYAGCSVLHLAVMKGTKFWVELLEKSDPQQPIDNPTEEDKIKYHNRIDVCLNSGCSVIMKNAEGLTPIHLAFKLCDKQTTDLLLSKCDDNSQEPGQISFFHIACATGNTDVFKRLLKKGTDINRQTSISFQWFTKKCSQESKPDPIVVSVNSTALHIAAICQNKEIVEVLVDTGANIYAQNRLGLTPIHLSMVSCDIWGHADCKVIAQLLLEKAQVLKESVSNSGLSHLHVAAYTDDTNAIEKLLQMGTDIDRVFKIDEPELSHLTQYSNRTPLHVAILKWSRNAILTLVKNGADILQQTPETATPLQTLVRAYGHKSEVISCIKDKLSRTREAVDANGTTPLHIACHIFDFEWAKELLENGADANAQVFQDDVVVGWTGYTPMHILIISISEQGDVDRQKKDSLVKLLIEYGAHPLILSHNGHSALLLAHYLARDDCFNDDNYGMHAENSTVYLPIADMLLKNQPTYKVNPVDSHGFSHFHYACMRNEVDVVEKFLDNGIDINHTANVMFPGSEMDGTDQDATNFTPLHFAVYYRSVEVASLLIERGANINAKSEDGETPLHIAVQKGLADSDFFEILLRAKMQQNNYNLVQDIVSIRRGDKLELNLSFYLRHIQRFIDMGCKIDQQDERGETALNKANHAHNLEAVEALLLLGANVNIIDEENRPPIDNYWWSDSGRHALTSKMLADHVWKMKVAGLKVHELCETVMLEIHKRLPLNENFKCQCEEELDKLSNEKIGQSLNMRSFLRESGPATNYPTMSFVQREYVDKIFANVANLRQSFPQFSGLLMMQYRKALDRLKWHGVAMDLLPSVLQVDMPYLCLENILKYFDNDELKYFVEEHADAISVDAKM